MNRNSLREGLLGAVAPSPELERRYRERVAALFDRRLTPVERISIAAGLLLVLWVSFRLVQSFVRAGTGAPLVTLVGLAVGLAFCAGMIVFSVWQLRGGVEDFRTHGLTRTGLVAMFTAALALLMLWAGVEARDPATGIRLILFGVVFWTTLGLPFYLTHLVRHGELRLRVELLRIELSLAEAAERGEGRS